ncbi:MAG: peptide ABC transporter substrate-binding protein [Candidatus Schekmanbacteria bacterium]|nr:peptide ABC transporter substrate-binding protein [Candidatus Schekmanbacteria bacterium]
MRLGANAGLLLALLAACTGGPEKAGPAARAGQYHGALAASLRHLDPALMEDHTSSIVGTQLFDGLVQYRRGTFDVEPALAERWEVTADQKVWRFFLRKGVRFHDDPCFPGGRGREVTAADVVYSFHRLGDAAVGSLGGWIFADKVAGFRELAAGTAKSVSGFRVLDDHSLEVELVDVFAPFLHLLTTPYAYVVPREAVEYYGELFDRHPVGTGPFRLVRWDAASEILLVRHDGYWEKAPDGPEQLPLFSQVSFRFLVRPIEMLGEFEARRLDNMEIVAEVEGGVYAPIDGGVPGTDRVLLPKWQERQVVLVSPRVIGGLYFMAPAQSAAGSLIEGNRDVRLALNWAIDRERLIREILGPTASPAGRVIPPGMDPLPPPQPAFGYDLPRARQLLASAGYPGGKGFPPLRLLTSSGITSAIADFVSSTWAELGITSTVQVVPWSEQDAAQDSGRYDMYSMGWSADYPDAENFLRIFYTPSVVGIRYAEPDFRALFEKALGVLDTQERYGLYRKAEALILRDAPVAFLYHTRNRDYLQQPWLKGVPISNTGLYFLKYGWIEAEGMTP